MKDLVSPRLADADLVVSHAVCHFNGDIQQGLDVVYDCVCVFHFGCRWL